MSQPVKVLHLIDTLSVGGAERLILGLAERIDKDRFEIHVCCLGVLHGNALQPEFERLHIPVRVLGAKRFYDPGTIKRLIHYVRQHQIDVIHTHLTHADIVGRIIARMLRLPVVSTLHNEPRNYNRDRFDRRWLEQLTARYLTTRLIAVSQRIQRQFIQEWSIPAERIARIYNAVPMDVYFAVPEQPVRDPHGGPVVTNIGRLSSQKAQHILLEAAQFVLEQRADTRFLIVGQGRRAQELKDRAQSLGIAAQVMFTGVRHDVAAILADSDVFVLSSLWEGLPLTAVEAMAAARPVVLTDVGGNSELVEDGVQGFLVQPGDARMLADALLTLLNDAPRRLAMGRAARSRVRYDFSMDMFVTQHEAVYTEVTQKKPATINKANASVELK